MGREGLKSTVAGILAGINMMMPTGGLATSKEETPKDIKPTTSVTDVLIGENKSSELEKLEEKEVNQRFAQFLNGEGEYSDEKLKLQLWINNDKVSDLGYSRMGFQNHFIFQSILLFHKNIDGEEILALGLKDRSGERVITGVAWPVDDIIALGYGVHTGESIGKIYGNSIAKSYFYESEIGSLLNENMGLLVNFTMNITPDDVKAQFPNQEFGKTYLSFFADKGNINRSFLTGIWRPEVNDMLSSRTKDVFKKYKNKGFVQQINNYSDFLDLIDKSDELPFVNTLYY